MSKSKNFFFMLVVVLLLIFGAVSKFLIMLHMGSIPERVSNGGGGLFDFSTKYMFSRKNIMETSFFLVIGILLACVVQYFLKRKR